jgi:hypothetical protein
VGTSTHQITSKKLRAAQPGELIRCPFGDGTALAILIKQETEEALVAYLEGAGDFQPFWTWFHDLDARCLSYGTQWQVEPEGTSTLFADQGEAPSGSLAVTPQGLGLRLRPDRGQQGTLTVRIDNMDKLPTEHYDHIQRWRLWLNPLDRQAAHGHPAFTFGYPQGSGAT